MELLLIIVGVAIIGFLISMAFNKMSSRQTSQPTMGFGESKSSPTLSSMSSLSNSNPPNTIVLTTLDGGNLIFSEEGVAYVSNTKKIYIKKSDIVSFNYEKLSDNVYRIKIASNFEVIDTTVNKEELKKLFTPITSSSGPQRGVGAISPTGFAPSFSWLGPLLGFGAGMLAGSLLDDLFESSHAHEISNLETSTQESSQDDLSFPEDNLKTDSPSGDIDVDAAGFGIDPQDSSYDDFSQDLDEPTFDDTSFDSGDDLSFPDDSDLV